MKVKAVQGKEFSLKWTEKSGRRWDWWQDPGVPLFFPVESASSGDATGTPEFFLYHVEKGSLLSSYVAETGLLWMWAGHSCYFLSGDEYVGELLELQQACEGPYGSYRG